MIVLGVTHSPFADLPVCLSVELSRISRIQMNRVGAPWSLTRPRVDLSTFRPIVEGQTPIFMGTYTDAAEKESHAPLGQSRLSVSPFDPDYVLLRALDLCRFPHQFYLP